jgi:hypothetical protein
MSEQNTQAQAVKLKGCTYTGPDGATITVEKAE